MNEHDPWEQIRKIVIALKRETEATFVRHPIPWVREIKENKNLLLSTRALKKREKGKR